MLSSAAEHSVLWESGGALCPISAALSISVGLDCYRYPKMAKNGVQSSEFRILVDMIRVPDWAFEAAGQELRSMSQDAATYHPGLYLTPAQAKAVEALIQVLPKFRLKAVPDDCGECLICLEEFQIGHEILNTRLWCLPLRD
ncbi:hypothetical protein Bca52824_036239 [Brassica carinata]|uniref:Uncharacterized protein n=1 Tax=Brassica carinata TaxID=52824 RepID=A0A8X7S4I7_BRACI|nr:hypothetical protein Bca52824_036239 [Brassica carinata]